MDIVNRHRVAPFVTRDGSIIREILAPRNSCVRRQSLAEATLPVGASTEAHTHPVAEELYYVLAGSGRIAVGDEQRDVRPGDGIALPPGTPHQIRNLGPDELVFLCCCVPAYEHEDTVMVPSMLD